MRPLLFDKYEGLGNDFVVTEGTPHALSREEVRAICDRHRGIGADGVLFCGVSAGRPYMHVINADGSTAEMCGNGIRCVALHLVKRGRVDEHAFEIDTDAGPHPVRVLELSAPGKIEVAMRPPSLVPSEIPARAEAPLIDELLSSLDVRVTAVSMGNPHAVTFDVPGSARQVLGPKIQGDARFPSQVNVGFALMTSPSAIDLEVYERGSGWTQACGTGACAAAVAAVETGRARRGEPIDVTLPGGKLRIVVRGPGERVLMTGPARHVFSGKIEL